MLVGAHGSFSRPLSRMCTALVTAIKQPWLLWMVWLYYPTNKRQSVCRTSVNQLSNDRQHTAASLCVCVGVFKLRVRVGWKLRHPRILTLLPSPKRPRLEYVLSCNPCVCIYCTVFFLLICSGLAQVGLGAGAWHTLNTHSPGASETDHEPHMLNLCVLVCAFPLISCLWNEEMCFRSRRRRKGRKEKGQRKRKSKTKQIIQFSLICGSIKPK